MWKALLTVALKQQDLNSPCPPPTCRPAPKNEDEMMVAIFEYIDRLFNIVRPRRVLYMAIDGVVGHMTHVGSPD